MSQNSLSNYNGTKEDLIEYSELMKKALSPFYISNTRKPVLRDDKVQCIFVFGQRGSGKSVLIEQYAEWYYRHGITPLYIWAARSNENVTIGVNKNCKYHWDKVIKKQEELVKTAENDEMKQKIQKMIDDAKNSLHCNCRNAYPVSWLVPDYWEFSGVEQYNTCWSGKEEYDIAYERGLVTRPSDELINSHINNEKDDLINRKLKKPKHLIKTDLIRICPFTIPTDKKKAEEFAVQFVKYLLDARKGRRWIVMNPMMFLTPDDKFKTISYIVTHLQNWMEDYFQPPTPESVAKMRGISKPVPSNEWSKIEENSNKAALIFSELRTVAPTNRYSPETKSSLSKRSIIDISAELRHKNLYLIGDLQNAEDLNESIKPLSDFIAIKNATQQLLGKEYYYFIQGIENRRKSLLIKMSHGQYMDFSKAPPQFKYYLDRFIPRIQELPVNKTYVVWPNNEHKLMTVYGASWHHKQEGESLQSLTGITWKLKREHLQSTNVSETKQNITEKQAKSSKKQDTMYVMRWCVEEFIRTGGWPTVVINLAKKVDAGDLPMTPVSDLDHKTISNKIRKDEKMKLNLDTAKNMKDKKPDEIIRALKW